MFPTPTPMNRAVCGYTVEANGRDPEYSSGSRSQTAQEATASPAMQ
jgi:hypothetical protein